MNDIKKKRAIAKKLGVKILPLRVPEDEKEYQNKLRELEDAIDENKPTYVYVGQDKTVNFSDAKQEQAKALLTEIAVTALRNPKKRTKRKIAPRKRTATKRVVRGKRKKVVRRRKR